MLINAPPDPLNNSSINVGVEYLSNIAVNSRSALQISMLSILLVFFVSACTSVELCFPVERLSATDRSSPFKEPTPVSAITLETDVKISYNNFFADPQDVIKLAKSVCVWLRGENRYSSVKYISIVHY